MVWWRPHSHKVKYTEDFAKIKCKDDNGEDHTEKKLFRQLQRTPCRKKSEEENHEEAYDKENNTEDNDKK